MLAIAARGSWIATLCILTFVLQARTGASAASPPDWSGVYGGLLAGYSLGFSSQSAITSDYSSNNYGVSGGLVGGDFGFNYQFGNWVIGLDTEIDAADLKGSKAPAFSSSLDALLMTRARFGYAIGQFMPYIGLGPAYSEFASSAVLPGAGPISNRQTRAGWSFALGADYSITQNLFVRADYTYVCFGEAVVGNVDNVVLMGHYFRLGLDYKFDVDGLKKEPDEVVDAGRPYNWSGFYVGPSIGGGAIRQSTALSLNNVPLVAGDEASAGGITGFGLQGTVGFEAGANWQVGSFILGAETDFHQSQLTGQGVSPHFSLNINGVSGNFIGSDTIDEQGSLRVRAGWPLGRWLIYGTAGLAYASIESSSTFTTKTATSDLDYEATHLGPIVGLGVERAIWSNWTTRLEYLYADFGRVGYSFNGPAPIGGTVGSRIGVSEHILRVGFNMMFN